MLLNFRKILKKKQVFYYNEIVTFFKENEKNEITNIEEEIIEENNIEKKEDEEFEIISLNIETNKNELNEIFYINNLTNYLNFYDFVIKKISGIYFEFDSYLLETSEFSSLNKFRLLEVNREAILPTRIATKILVTSLDVLHSFSLPFFGIKIDAVPGRINHFNFENLKSGHYYGQCSELCGSRHGMMPIGIKTLSDKNFDNFFIALLFDFEKIEIENI